MAGSSHKMVVLGKAGGWVFLVPINGVSDIDFAPSGTPPISYPHPGPSVQAAVRILASIFALNQSPPNTHALFVATRISIMFRSGNQ